MILKIQYDVVGYFEFLEEVDVVAQDPHVKNNEGYSSPNREVSVKDWVLLDF